MLSYHCIPLQPSRSGATQVADQWKYTMLESCAANATNSLATATSQMRYLCHWLLRCVQALCQLEDVSCVCALLGEGTQWKGLSARLPGCRLLEHYTAFDCVAFDHVWNFTFACSLRQLCRIKLLARTVCPTYAWSTVLYRDSTPHEAVCVCVFLCCSQLIVCSHILPFARLRIVLIVTVVRVRQLLCCSAVCF
jgi:hypothetical protein